MDAQHDTEPTDCRRKTGVRSRLFLGLVGLFLFSLGLRLAAIQHGEGHNYLPDTHVVRSALGMAKDLDPVPPVGLYSTYPNLLPYSLLPIYAGEFALGRVLGWWHGAGEFEQAIKERPSLVHLPARVWFALLCSLTPLVVFATARLAGLGFGAWVAAALVASGLLHLHFSVQERPWGPLVLFLALSAWFAARHARSPRPRNLMGCAAAAGLAFATHQAGAIGLALPGLAWLLGPWGWSGPALRRRLGWGVAAVAVFAVVALLLGHPYYLVHGAPETLQVAAGEQLAEGGSPFVAIGGQAVRLTFGLATFRRLSAAFFGYDPLLVIFALLGIGAALRHRTLLPVTLFALGWAGFFLTNSNDHVRYLLPLSVLFAPAAGITAQRLGRSPVGRWAVCALFLLPLIQALRLITLLNRSDTRTLAEHELIESPLDGTLAVDIGGPELPLDLPSLERLASWRPLTGREGQRRELYAAGLTPAGPQGLDAIPLDALLGYEVRHFGSWLRPAAVEAGLGPTPDLLFKSLGVRYVLLTDRTPGDPHPALLVDPAPADPGWRKLEPLTIETPALRVFDPRRFGRATEARLPTEMDFALTDLWRVERPGPLLELCRVLSSGR